MSTTTTETILESLTAQESAGAVKNKANLIQAHTRDSPDAAAHRMSAGALSSLQDQINALNKALRGLATIISSGSTPVIGDSFQLQYLGQTVSVINSILRTQTQKSSEIRSVRDFGAVGDGVTDDLQAIRNAIGSLPQNLFAPLGLTTTVNTSGSTVSVTSGAPLDQSLTGQTVGINGVNFTVLSVSGVASMIVSPSAGTLTGVALTRYANTGSIEFPDPPGGAYLISGTLLLSPFVSLVGISNARVRIRLSPGVAEATSSVVNTSGTAVTWVSGAVFTSDLVGMRAIIDGQAYDIFSFTDSHHITLTTHAPIASSKAMAVETWTVKVLLAGDTRGPIAPQAPFTENSRLENLWIDGGWEDGAHNRYSSGLFYPVAQISCLRNVLVSECGQRGIFDYGGAFTVFENVWSNSHGVGPGFDCWNCHDIVITGLWAESINSAGTYLDGDGDFMAGTRFQFCQNVLTLAWDGENCSLPMKIAGCSNVVFATAFFNGNLSVPPIGCKITDLLYNGATSNGVKFDRAQAGDCAIAIYDTSISYVSGQPRNRSIPGALSWHGLVNTSGTAVTRVSGTSFTQDLVGLFPSINGAFGYQVTAVADASHLTLDTSAGTQTSVAFDCVPFNYLIQYEQDKYIPSLIGRTGLQLAVSDDDALNFGGAETRWRGGSAGVNRIFGVPRFGDNPQTITSIANPGAGTILLTVPGHLMTFSDRLAVIASVTGQTAINGRHLVSIVDSDTISVDDLAGNGVASTGGTIKYVNEFVFNSEFDDSVVQGGKDSGPRDVVLRPGDTEPELRVSASGGGSGSGKTTIGTDVEFQQPISFDIPIAGSAGSPSILRGGDAGSPHPGVLQLTTIFDQFYIQTGNNAGPRDMKFQWADTGPAISLESDGIWFWNGGTKLARVDTVGVGRFVTAILSSLTANRLVRSDGSKILISGTVDLASSNDVSTSILGVVNGGTGASTAAGARANLGVPDAANTYTKAQVDSAIAAALASANNYTDTQIAALSASVTTALGTKADHGTYAVVAGNVTI